MDIVVSGCKFLAKLPPAENSIMKLVGNQLHELLKPGGLKLVR